MRIFLPTNALLSTMLAAAVLTAQQPQKPSPTELGANLPAQAIGANDLIAVSVYDAPELSRTLRVTADGFIRMPMVKQRIRVKGLEPSEVETAIRESLQAEQILNEPAVTVTIAEYHSRPISVAGAVKRPLVFQATTTVSLLEAISRAEGLREDAGPEILVSRVQPGPDGKAMSLTQRIPVRALIDAADPAMNLELTGGEEIRVPESSKIYVVGNVRRPGAFPVQNGNETTVLQMLALAEGLMPFASKQAYIYRREAEGPKNELPIELEKIMQRKSPDVPLLANDILYIPDNKSRRLTVGTLERLMGIGGAIATGVVIFK